MDNQLFEEYLRELFNKKKEEQYEKEVSGELDTSYMELNIDALELMGELADTLNEKQLELFKKINMLNLEYLEECEFNAFKNGYTASLEKLN